MGWPEGVFFRFDGGFGFCFGFFLTILQLFNAASLFGLTNYSSISHGGGGMPSQVGCGGFFHLGRGRGCSPLVAELS